MSDHQVRGFITVLLLISCHPAFAEGDGQERLLGDWGGLRPAGQAAGVESEVVWKGGAWRSAGGARDGSDFVQSMEVKLEIDTTSLWSIRDSSAYLHLLWNGSGAIDGNYLQSFSGVDNIEAEQGFKLFEAWFVKHYPERGLSLLAGVYPVDSEFYVSDASTLFLHPSFGPGSELAQTGAHGPSLYPLSSLGFRLKYQAPSTLYAQVAWLDGDPGSASAPHWSRVNPFHGDGSFLVTELGWWPAEAGHLDLPEPERGGLATPTQRLEERYEPVGKIAAGWWSYSEPHDSLYETDGAGTPVRHRDHGYYLLLERDILRSEDLLRGAALFFRYGWAEPRVNAVSETMSLGLRVRGPWAKRVDDLFGVALTRSRVSEPYRLAGAPTPADETVAEVTYRLNLRPWLAIQPAILYFRHPGLSSAAADATLYGMRFEIAF